MNTNRRTKEYLKSSSFLFSDEYISMDFETTGLSPSTNEIIDIGAVKVKNGEIQDTFSMLIRPKEDIKPYITNLTGISNEMVKDAPYIESVLPNFLSFIGDRMILGQNVGFDLDFLYHAMKKDSDDEIFKYTDTLKLSLILLPMLSHHRLKDLVEYYEIQNDYGFHRALGDCVNTMKVYEEMKKQILEYYGSFENFQEEPYAVIDKKGCTPKEATFDNITLASDRKLRNDIINGNIRYFTNHRGLCAKNRSVFYHPISKERLLHAYSDDIYTEFYEKPFREKKSIKAYLKENGAILPNKMDHTIQSRIVFSPMELEDYLDMVNEGIDVYCSKDVIDFIEKEKKISRKANNEPNRKRTELS